MSDVTSRARSFCCAVILGGMLAWGTPARADDAHTVFSLAFNNSLTGTQGEVPTTASGITYEPGVNASGAYMAPGNQLYYTSSANIGAVEGTLEFWIKPRWNGNDGQTHTILRFGGGGGMLFAKDGANNLRSIFNRFAAGGQPERGVSINISGWVANAWHHVAYTWSNTTHVLKLYVDGQLAASSPFTGSLPGIPDATFQIGGDGARAHLDGVLDDLRVSDLARTDSEIAQRFLAGLTVTSLAANPSSVSLLETWWRLPQLTATTVIGNLSIPSSAASWTSTNSAVASVDAQGRIRANAPGSATLTASLNGASAPISVTVTARVRQPDVQAIDPFLATPAPDYLYSMPVVVLRYLPTLDGVNVDVATADWNSTLASLNSRVNLFDIQTKFMLEEGSRFRGYANGLAKPSLGYRIVSIVTVYEPLPPDLNPAHGTGSPGVYFPDYEQILTRWNGQQFVDQQGVREFWVWGYHYGSIVPVESNMSSPTTGDISNSYRFQDDLPIYSKTYTLYNYNFTRSSNESVHNHGHQLESILSHVNQLQDGNTDLFWKKFVGQNASGQSITGRCGSTHIPPNTTSDYDYGSLSPALSDIADWTPAHTGAQQSVSALTWGGLTYPWPLGAPTDDLTQHQWYIYWMQAMPGDGNTIPNGAGRMTNWWAFTGDWDRLVPNISSVFGLYTTTTATAFNQQPFNKHVCRTESATFSVSVGGVGPFTYRWRRNDVDLADGGHVAGSATASLLISNADSTDADTYRCIVSNNFGSVSSGSAVLVVGGGDLDHNGVVNTADITILVAVLAGQDTSPTDVACADVDASGQSDGRDVQAFVRSLLGP